MSSGEFVVFNLFLSFTLVYLPNITAGRILDNIHWNNKPASSVIHHLEVRGFQILEKKTISFFQRNANTCSGNFVDVSGL